MPAADLVQAVLTAHRGTAVIDPAISRNLTRSEPSSQGREADFDRLTSRELDVARLVAQGLANKEIAARLSISTRTVEGHLNRIFDKLGVRSRTGLVRLAMSRGGLPAP
jgi:DNA-binding NarL/FixJ family response regulator